MTPRRFEPLFLGSCVFQWAVSSGDASHFGQLGPGAGLGRPGRTEGSPPTLKLALTVNQRVSGSNRTQNQPGG